ncbi:hypothetical protein Kpho02_77000 [Kitasatospora phosalacinea]|uniref:Uncharacterized protein n=1 Tax=Kitasatospora phosalacinea TaxID=2065 RepID=A0A9W6QI77_9ACTN|nr:hypothetical protein [Kitasatospora phosalacinea]GLW75403.1 hypothetical protein Kpho02_77000 [Kitasatospora phosalacinea]
MHTVLRNLASNPALRPEHVDALIAHGDPDVLLELRLQPELTPGQLGALVATGGRQAFLDLIRSGAMPTDRIPEDDPLAELAAFGRPDPAGRRISRLLACPSVEVRCGLAENIGHDYDIAENTLTSERRAAILTLAQDLDCAVVAATVRLLEDLGEPQTRHRTEACVRIALALSTTDGEVLRSLLIADGPAPLTPCPHHPEPAAALTELRRTAIGNRLAPAEAVEELLDATWPALAVPAASYWSGLRPETYQRLTALGDPQITARVAGNRGAPTELIRHLYDAQDGRWRSNVLSNQTTIPIDLLVREALTGGSGGGLFHQDLDGMMALADHPDPRVRKLALGHVRLRPEVRTRLISDPDPTVAFLAVIYTRDPDQFRAAAHRYGPSSHTDLALTMSCPPDLLLTIAQDRDSPFEAALAVAWNENATAAALAACLSNHPGPEMDQAVAENPAASPEQLCQVVRGGDLQTWRAAASNPQLPPQAVDMILAAALSP